MKDKGDVRRDVREVRQDVREVRFHGDGRAEGPAEYSGAAPEPEAVEGAWRHVNSVGDTASCSDAPELIPEQIPDGVPRECSAGVFRGRFAREVCTKGSDRWTKLSPRQVSMAAPTRVKSAVD